MKGKTKKIVLAVAVIGAVAAGGVAFTAANTVPDSVAGYGTSTVIGRDVTDRSTTPCRLMARHRSTTVVAHGDHDRQHVQAGFDADGSRPAAPPCNDARRDRTVDSTDVVHLPRPAPYGHRRRDRFNVAVTGTPKAQSASAGDGRASRPAVPLAR